MSRTTINIHKFKAICINPTSTLTKNKEYLVEAHEVIGNWWGNTIFRSFRVINDRGITINVKRNRFKKLSKR